jgi:hypothetical protein
MNKNVYDLADSIFGSSKSSSHNNENEKQTTKILPDVKEALNEYFKLKLKYNTIIEKSKKKILNDPTLSNKEKRYAYLQLKPKCINCTRPGGTIFKTIYSPESDKDEAYREYRASCGIIADPCNLDIKIQMGKVELLPNLLNSLQKEISDLKNKIIDDKNKLLFGYLTTEEALQNFDEVKENISFYSSLYEEYLKNYNLLVDNDDITEELNESITNSYIQINEIKECIKKRNETNNLQYSRDAVNIYNEVLIPLFQKIRALKYNENMVWRNEDTNTCNLLQNKYSIQNLSYSSFTDKIISYNVGLEVGKKKKPQLIIESSSDSMPETFKSGEIPQDEPIYINGGISWKIPEYNNLWNSLSTKFKDILMTNNQWMKDFMFNCVNAKSKKIACTFTSPPDLKIPPNILPNGEVDFGVKIYNDEYKKLSKTLQQTYMTLYATNKETGVKTYDLMINAMNDIVAKEVGFNKGFI